MINLTVTEAVLKMYDSGTVSPPAIVAQLIYAYPTLTIATARSIIENHRLKKNNPNAWKEPQLKIRPKSKADILQDNLHAKCRNCGYHQEGKPCVLPASMCPYEDMDAQMKELLDLRKKEASKPTKQKQKGETANRKANHVKQSDTRGLNIFDEFENDLDSMNRCNPNTQQKRIEDITQVFDTYGDVPDGDMDKCGVRLGGPELTADDSLILDDFEDLLAGV